MNRNEKNDMQRDSELDLLLSPLRKAQPSAEALKNWEISLQNNTSAMRGQVSKSEKIFSPKRIIEWAVAASIGFLVASVVINQKQDSVEDVVVAKNVFDMDATEVHLVAK